MRGRRRKLTDAQIEALERWNGELQALGTQKDNMQRAEADWRARRREIGYLKQICVRMGICTSTAGNYLRRVHKT